MKKLIVTALSLMISLVVFSQDPIKSGKIIYKEVHQLDIQLEGDAAAFADMLPKERTSYKALYFNEDAALYENTKLDSEEAASHMEEVDGMQVQIQMVEPENKTYISFNDKELIEQREFMTRMFLIKSELKGIDWKITGKQKQILDYQCTEAVCKNSKDEEVIAYFCPQIPVSAGPDTLGQLPGMIMEVSMNDGKSIITAMQFDDEQLEKGSLKKPKKGKKVSAEEYNAIVAEKMKEMGAEGGARGVHTVVEVKHQ